MHIQQGNPSARGGFVCESPSPRASLQLDPMLDFEFENPRIYEPIYRNDVEELELYTYGGYYPVHLHDVLMDRYKIRAKLGFGNYYTLWLAEDLEIQDRPVAIKIFTANFTADTTRHQPYLLRCAVQSENSFGGREYIAQIEDMFTVEGPNGEHLCIVMDMYGASLAQYQAGYVNGRMSMKGFLPLEMVKRIACQVAKGLAYLHSIGIVHGDVSPENIHLTLEPNRTIKDLRDFFGRPERIAVRRTDGMPLGPQVPQYVVPTCINNILDITNINLRTAKIKIKGFGESFLFSMTEKEGGGLENRPLNTSLPLRAPEALLDDRHSVGPATDVWSFACLVYWLFSGGSHLFSDPIPLFTETTDRILIRVGLICGAFPTHLWSRWRNRHKWFDYDGRPIVAKCCWEVWWTEGKWRGMSIDSLVERIGRRNELSATCRSWLKKIFLEMLRICPRERMDSRVVVKEFEAHWNNPRNSCHRIMRGEVDAESSE